MGEMRSATPTAKFDTSSDPEFVDYYTKESLSETTRHRFETVRQKIIKLARAEGRLKPPLKMVDVGCGAGTQSMIWASAGEYVSGIDINAQLIEVARQRAAGSDLKIQFDVGSATALPYETGAYDVCLLPELLEHVQDWERCLNEAIRVLKPGGILFLSTTNYLCPRQQEFNLPFYSWYPKPLKRHFERLAVTSRPELANYARYPAVHWFSYYGLARFLRERGMVSRDRFDMIETDSLSGFRKTIVEILRRSSLVKFAGHLCTPSTAIFAIKA